MPRVTRRVPIAATVIAASLVILAATFAVVRPALVDRWSLYASATGGPSDAYALFLEPFPTAYSCTVEARIIIAHGGHAVCRDRLRLEFGTREQDLLWAEFWPSARWIAICQARFRQHPFVGRAAPPARVAAAPLR